MKTLFLVLIALIMLVRALQLYLKVRPRTLREIALDRLAAERVNQPS